MANNTISKTELAHLCGVTPPTVYAWIRVNRGGIQGYIIGKRIDTSILREDPYKADIERTAAGQPGSEPAKDKEDQKQRAKLQEQIDSQAARIQELEQTIDAKEKTLAGQAAELEHLQEINRLLHNELDTAHKLHAMTLAALPAPRKTIGERIKGLFKRSSGDQTEQ